jgi:hypothetical protein
MRSLAYLALPAFVTLLGASGCSGKPCGSSFSDASNAGEKSSASPPSASANAGAAAPADASRAVSEADIVQLDHEQNRIYAISKSGSLAIVDASVPAKLTLMGKTGLSGEPFEMYRRGDILLTMSNGGSGSDGNPVPVILDGDGTVPPAPDAKASALLSAIDVSDPAKAHTIATFRVPGEIADSRIVGNVLYLATFEDGQCYGCTTNAARTLVTTFDIANPTTPKQIDQLTFASPAGAGFNYAWSTPWKRSIIATNERMYVGGLASSQDTTTDEGVIQVLDITDPTGHLTVGAKVITAGPVLSRWQMDESNGVLRVISQRGAGRTGNGEKFPDVDTFRIESTQSLVRLGHTTLTLPRQEGLKTVRFDGPRAYAITFNQTDPLFAIDLSDPVNPAQKGELSMPGWMYYLEPHGDRVIGLGLDRNDQAGNLNVSLFDVSNMATPTLVKRVSFGPTNMYEDYSITNGVLAEDQDRIQKAFRVFEDGLIAIPFSGAGTSGTSSGSSCSAQGSGIQLVDWTATSLTKHAMLPVSGNARRAIRRDSAVAKELIAVSDSNVSSFSIDLRDAPKQTADVVIGTCVTRTTPNGGAVGVGGGRPGGGDYYPGGYDRAYGDDSGSVWNGTLCR